MGQGTHQAELRSEHAVCAVVVARIKRNSNSKYYSLGVSWHRLNRCKIPPRSGRGRRRASTARSTASRTSAEHLRAPTLESRPVVVHVIESLVARNPDLGPTLYLSALTRSSHSLLSLSPLFTASCPLLPKVDSPAPLSLTLGTGLAHTVICCETLKTPSGPARTYEFTHTHKPGAGTHSARATHVNTRRARNDHRNDRNHRQALRAYTRSHIHTAARTDTAIRMRSEASRSLRLSLRRHRRGRIRPDRGATSRSAYGF